MSQIFVKKRGGVGETIRAILYSGKREGVGGTVKAVFYGGLIVRYKQRQVFYNLVKVKGLTYLLMEITEKVLGL